MDVATGLNVQYQCPVCGLQVAVNSVSTLILDFAQHLLKHEIQRVITPLQRQDLMQKLYKDNGVEQLIR